MIDIIWIIGSIVVGAIGFVLARIGFRLLFMSKVKIENLKAMNTSVSIFDVNGTIKFRKMISRWSIRNFFGS